MLRPGVLFFSLDSSQGGGRCLEGILGGQNNLTVLIQLFGQLIRHSTNAVGDLFCLAGSLSQNGVGLGIDLTGPLLSLTLGALCSAVDLQFLGFRGNGNSRGGSDSSGLLQFPDPGMGGHKLIVQLFQLRSVLVGHIFQILDNIFSVETVKTGTKSGISGQNRSSYAANNYKKYSTQTEKKQLFCGSFSESREKIRK